MISFKHKAIFIHIPKCGGQSIETLFLNDLGLDWNNRDSLILRRNPNKNLGPDWLAHLKAKEYVNYSYISEDLWSEFYKFTVVREPVDRAYSMYRYLGFEKTYTFSKFIERVLVPNLDNGPMNWFCGAQFEFLLDKSGNLEKGVDIYRLEDLGRLTDELHRRYGENFMSIPHVNKSRANIKSHIKNYAGRILQGHFGFNFSSDSRPKHKDIELIRELYSKDYEFFGYE